ncbi:Zinc finger- C3HC4 type (RING finger) family protein [Striga hermonthica]|uniref:RING-type E3 ubiquitin transferase n=1 Tax=Striga hermonthica TaxID=68872 RepID=A0A9N7R6M8_STRHE|nr:Zinc finger- C3HC4 type (RING finger) family protein [Striga hermonthica]
MSSDDTSSTSLTIPTVPLLRPRRPANAASDRPSALSLLLSHAASTTQRRGGASMVVRETAARELEERRADWGYSKPVVALDIMWNMAFVVVSVIMLIFTAKEKPHVPIRVWVCGYALQCLVHVVLVWVEYNRRNSGQEGNILGGGSREEDIQSEDEVNDVRSGLIGISNASSRVKRCESVNTMISFLWWIVGFYWVVSGGEALLTGAPRLYWLAVVFLAFDVVFAIFCVVLACLIGIALCCCLPCIIAILYAIAGQEGASEADLSILPKYKFQANKDEERVDFAAGTMVPIETSAGYMPNERILSPEDASHQQLSPTSSGWAFLRRRRRGRSLGLRGLFDGAKLGKRALVRPSLKVAGAFSFSLEVEEVGLVDHRQIF